MSDWKLEKTVNIYHVLLILGMAYGVGAWASDEHGNLNSRMNSVEQTLDHHKAMFDMQQESTVEELRELKGDIKDLIKEFKDFKETH